MPIETEWDPLHAERLIYLQTRLRKPLPEVLAAVIDLAMANHDRTGPIKPSVWEARTRQTAWDRSIVSLRVNKPSYSLNLLFQNQAAFQCNLRHRGR